jgi:D-sedoheptulose 7-phosphate isomerase
VRRVREAAALRVDAAERFFPPAAERIARLCHRMAERFARGGRLIAVGASPASWSDARHVAVEFVHPVIVGKRALPAMALPPADAALVAEAADIMIAFGSEAEVGGAVADARSRGCLTIAFAHLGADWEFPPPADADAFVAQELVETLYHVLWELGHVFFEHRGLLEGRSDQRKHDTGASSFLYPFLGEQETDLEAVVADVRQSVLMKADEVSALRAATLHEGCGDLLAAARAVGECFQRGGTLLALGNGGSATDAQDLVADLRARGRRAIDLADDSGIITAVANDIGVEAIFARQVIAYGRSGDVLLALSTSGNSENLIAALAEARRRGLATVAMVGYDGGRVAADAMADHVIVTRSQNIPRIQEAQASAYHVLCATVEGE